MSREVAGIAVFFNALGLYAVLTTMPGLVSWLLPQTGIDTLRMLCGWVAGVAGPLAIYAMNRIYRIRARPFWDHWQVLTTFYGSMLTLGALAVGVVYAVALAALGHSYSSLLSVLAWPMALGLMIEAAGLVMHARDLVARGGEAAASHMEQCTTFGNTYWLRNIGLAIGIVALLALGMAAPDGAAGAALWVCAAAVVVATAAIGRALFYVLVIPTTMPGAFFWRNKGFEEHARATGLANMPQVGVLPLTH